MKVQRILVATRGSTADEEAVKLACELARRSKAEVYVVYIIEVNRTLPLDAVIESDITRADEILTRAEDIAAENKHDIKTDLIQSREVGPAIVDVARERNIDLILMGLHYKKRFGAFDLGKAIPHVLEEAPCRVLLLRESIT